MVSERGRSLTLNYVLRAELCIYVRGSHFTVASFLLSFKRERERHKEVGVGGGGVVVS